MTAGRILAVGGGAGAPPDTVAGARTVWEGRVLATRAAVEDEALDRSIEYLERRYEAQPRNPVVTAGLAGRYAERFRTRALLDDLLRADALARALVELSMDTAAAQARLSASLLTQHRFPEALEAAERAVESDPGDDAAQGALFDAALAAGEYERAESALLALPADEPGRWIREAAWYEHTGRPDAAFDRMRRLCERVVQSERSQSLAAWCLTRLADLDHVRRGPEAAERWLESALRVRPGDRGAREGLAGLAAARGDWKRAKRLYEEILSEAHPDLYLDLADAHEALGNGERARSLRSEFLRLAGVPEAEALNAHFLAVHHAGSTGDCREATRLMERDLERRRSVESYEVASWVHLACGWPEEALGYTDLAVERGSLSPSGEFTRGRILEALGRPVEARELLESAMRDPTLLDRWVVKFPGR